MDSGGSVPELTCASKQFAAFRIALGLFLATHFLMLAPYAGEIYGPTGMYGAAFPTPFPNLLSHARTDEEVRYGVWTLAALGVLLTVGFQRRATSVVLWYGWACLTDRVPVLYVPSEGLVGWLLLLTALVPSGERWSISPRPREGWRLPSQMIDAVWIVLGVGYLASGMDKLSAPSWTEGTAIRSVLTSPISRWDVLAEAVEHVPDLAVALLTFTVLFFEITFLAMIWNRRTRMIAWTMAMLFHCGIRIALDLHTVTDPFLVAQILVFDPKWIQRGSRRSSSSSPASSRHHGVVSTTGAGDRRVIPGSTSKLPLKTR